MLFLTMVVAWVREAEMVVAKNCLAGARARISVRGPLAAYTEDFRAAMTAQGFSRHIVTAHTHLLANLSSWMRWHGLAGKDMTADRLDAFLAARRASGCRQLVSRRGLSPLLTFLRDRDVIPLPQWRLPDGPWRLLLERYGEYLRCERGLVALSVKAYVGKASLFLEGLPFTDVDALAALSAEHVTVFLVGEVQRVQTWAAKAMTTALRAFLRYLHIAGYISRPLTAAVPAVAGWALSALPRAVEADRVDAALRSCDRGTGRGRRDYAILLMLWRLGLRNGEVAFAELDDIDWQAGTITVRGKGSRRDVLPLPADVGTAVADYLVQGRPQGIRTRRLFVIDRAPYDGLARSSMVDVVYAACRRARVSVFSPHALRHTVASDLLARGAPLAEVGQLLRHSHENSTAVYAKLDRRRLGQLVRPWPVSVASGQRA